MPIFNKIITLSKQIAGSLLKDKQPTALDQSDLFIEEDKNYIFNSLTDENLIKKRFNLSNQIDKDADWKKLKSKIDVLVRRLYWKYAAAASVLIIVALTIFLNNGDNTQFIEPIIVNNNIQTGTDKATLTLENGEEVTLIKGVSLQTSYATSSGEEIIYQTISTTNPEIAYNYLTIPRGGQYFVKLSDGTQVWLNSDSKLKYPVAFIEGQTREVELVYGEAYFDVSLSKNHSGSKFNVNVLSGNQEVEVLGTEFNIKAYKDESHIYTTLVEGIVSVGNAIDKEILKPNEQSILNIESKNIIISEVDVYNETSWRKGFFTFKGKPLKDIMIILSRWYNIDIEIENKAVSNYKFIGTLSKNKNIEHILQTIKNTNNITYEITDNRIIIK